MDPRLLALPAAFGLAGASGLNATLPLLIVSGLAHFGVIHLASPYDVLASGVAFFGVLALAVVEFVVDKIPALDSIGHAVILPVSASSGAILFASQTGIVQGVNPGLIVVMSLIAGATTAGGVHLTRATVRPALNLALLGPVASTVEDALSAALALAAMLAPLLVVLIVAVVAFVVWRYATRLRTRLRTHLRMPADSP